MQIINAHKLICGNKIEINLFQDDVITFLELEDNGRGELNRYKNIHKFNYKTKNIETFKFNNAVDIVSDMNSGIFIYYAYIDRNKSNYWISLYKINCINLSEEKILSFDTDIVNSNEKDYVNLFLATRIINLNEQYIIIAIPSCGRKYGPYNFKKMLVVDLIEKKIVEIPDKFNDVDTFLRLDNVWVTDNREYVIFKTGRIQPFEKERIFKKQEKSKKIQGYYDSLETLVVFKLDEFTEQIKKGVLDKKNVIQIIDFEGALSVLGKNNSELIYLTNSFINNKVQITILNLESWEKYTFELKNDYDEILYFNKKFFGIREDQKTISIYDIYKDQKICNTDQRIIYFDEKNLITLKNSIQIGKVITCYKLIDGKIIDHVEYEARSFYFSYEKDALLLF